MRVHISDQQIYHALKAMGWSVSADGLTHDKIPAPAHSTNDCTALINSLRAQKGVSMCLLVENIDRGSQSLQVFETYVQRCGSKTFEMVDDEFDGTDCCKRTAPPSEGAAAHHGEETINGRTYDTTRFVEINGHRMFFISIVWIQARELRNFSAYPEVLVMDDKKKTNKHHHSFFAAISCRRLDPRSAA